jgi:hypothetical protein
MRAVPTDMVSAPSVHHGTRYSAKFHRHADLRLRVEMIAIGPGRSFHSSRSLRPPQVSEGGHVQLQVYTAASLPECSTEIEIPVILRRQ